MREKAASSYSTVLVQLLQRRSEQLLKNKNGSQHLQSTVEDNGPVAIVDDVFSELENIKDHIESCEQKAKESLEKAEAAYNKPVGFWHSSTPAIEALQDAAQNLGESQVEITETQSLLFRQQKTIANAVSKLFQLSVYNIAMTRDVVKEIQLRLSGASKEKISDLARKELEKVLLQLKRQLDLHEKYERLEKKINNCITHSKTLEEKMQTITAAVDKTCADLQCEKETFKQEILHEFENHSRQCREEISSFQSRSESEIKAAVEKTEGHVAEFLGRYKSKMDEIENGRMARQIVILRKLLFILCLITFLCSAGVIFLLVKTIF